MRGHLLADIDPLNMTTHHATELELENFGLTIWDLDREFITGGLHGKETFDFARDSLGFAARLLRKGRHRISPYSRAKKKYDGCVRQIRVAIC